MARLLCGMPFRPRDKRRFFKPTELDPGCPTKLWQRNLGLRLGKTEKQNRPPKLTQRPKAITQILPKICPSTRRLQRTRANHGLAVLPSRQPLLSRACHCSLLGCIAVVGTWANRCDSSPPLAVTGHEKGYVSIEEHPIQFSPGTKAELASVRRTDPQHIYTGFVHTIGFALRIRRRVSQSARFQGNSRIGFGNIALVFVINAVVR